MILEALTQKIKAKKAQSRDYQCEEMGILKEQIWDSKSASWDWEKGQTKGGQQRGPALDRSIRKDTPRQMLVMFLNLRRKGGKRQPLRQNELGPEMEMDTDRLWTAQWRCGVSPGCWDSSVLHRTWEQLPHVRSHPAIQKKREDIWRIQSIYY